MRQAYPRQEYGLAAGPLPSACGQLWSEGIESRAGWGSVGMALANLAPEAPHPMHSTVLGE